MTFALLKGLGRLRSRTMWFLEENYRAFVLQQHGVHTTEIQCAVAEWVADPLRQALDETRRTVGERLYEQSCAADCGRLKGRIRSAEIELVECARRLLSADVSRPGEGSSHHSQGSSRRRFLGALVILLLSPTSLFSWHVGGKSNQPTVAGVVPTTPLQHGSAIHGHGHVHSVRRDK